MCVSSQLLDACQLAPTVLINIKCKDRLEALREVIRQINIYFIFWLYLSTAENEQQHKRCVLFM